MADIAMTPYVNRLAALPMQGMWDHGRYPRLAVWFERVRARPSVTPALKRRVPDAQRAEMAENGRRSWPEVQAMLRTQEAPHMTRIVGISGSLRAGSLNTALLRAAQQLAPAGVTLEVSTLHGIPLYDGDLETRDGIPPAVTALKAQILASDGVLLATPEYNNSMPGVFKNAIDWLSRPATDIPRLFTGRPFALIGASPGGFGTILSQNAWLTVLRHLGARHWAGGRLMVSRAGGVFDAAGVLTDETVRTNLAKFVAEFAASLPKSGDALAASAGRPGVSPGG